MSFNRRALSIKDDVQIFVQEEDRRWVSSEVVIFCLKMPEVLPLEGIGAP